MTPATAATLAALLSAFGAPAEAASCADVPATHWAAEAVEISASVMDACRFNGDKLLTRAAAAEIVARLIETKGFAVPAGSTAPALSDVAADDPARGAIATAVAFGALAPRDAAGNPGGAEFRGSAFLNRFELAVIVQRLLAAKGSSAAGSSSALTDVPAGHWAASAVSAATGAGILAGYDGKFHGDKLINRYQAAVIVKKLLAALGP